MADYQPVLVPPIPRYRYHSSALSRSLKAAETARFLRRVPEEA